LYLGIAQQDNDLLDEALIGFVFSFIVGLIFFITLAILLRSYDSNKKVKNIKWYIDKILVALTAVWMTVATVLFSFYTEENQNMYLLFSVIIFLFIGISTTPNIVLYALNDMKKLGIYIL
jgi:ABC-type transport system involved in multi-copper enzyme maturation permease subunit